MPPPDLRGSGRVLVVEDDPLVRRVACRLLEAQGYVTLSAETPGEALAAAAGQGPVDYLLTDVVLPEMDGPQLAAALAANRPGLRVLYMSGYPPEVVFAWGMLAPGTPVLEKPFTRGEFLQAAADAFTATLPA